MIPPTWQAFGIAFIVVSALFGALYFWLKRKHEEDQKYTVGDDYIYTSDLSVRGHADTQIPEDVRYRSLFESAGITTLKGLDELDALTDVKGIGPERATDFAVDLKSQLRGSGLSATFEKNLLKLPGGRTVAVTEPSPEVAASA